MDNGLYGSDSGNAPDLVPFLLKCLSTIPKDMPARGPRELIEGAFKYVNNWSGAIEKFSGVEKIYYKDNEVYSAQYIGGLVDQRKDQM